MTTPSEDCVKRASEIFQNCVNANFCGCGCPTHKEISIPSSVIVAVATALQEAEDRVETFAKVAVQKGNELSDIRKDLTAARERVRVAEEAIKKWIEKNEATSKCTDLLRSNGISEEAHRIMNEYYVACSDLKALAECDRIEGEKPSGYWWCPSCKAEISPKNVTNSEHHEVCGNYVDWIENIPSPKPSGGDSKNQNHPKKWGDMKVSDVFPENEIDHDPENCAQFTGECHELGFECGCDCHQSAKIEAIRARNKKGQGSFQQRDDIFYLLSLLSKGGWV